jgi:hypothetical protein
LAFANINSKIIRRHPLQYCENRVRRESVDFNKFDLTLHAIRNLTPTKSFKNLGFLTLLEKLFIKLKGGMACFLLDQRGFGWKRSNPCPSQR